MFIISVEPGTDLGQATSGVTKIANRLKESVVFKFNEFTIEVKPKTKPIWIVGQYFDAENVILGNIDVKPWNQL